MSDELRKVDDIKYRDDLYPRIEKNPSTVQKYAEVLPILPSIEINQHNELIDGWHRWTAHKKNNETDIQVIVTETKSDAHFLELAIERNATHGLQLSQADKKAMARQIYHATPDSERIEKKKHLSLILSVPERTIRSWLSRIDKDSKRAREKRMLELWMACHTQQEIADILGITDRTQIAKFVQNGNFAKLHKSPESNHQVDFDVPLYNIWKYKENSTTSDHYGNTNIKILDNLLYLYTGPLDVVVDPFAGGGSTIDICKKRNRRYWVSDRQPIIEREHEIRAHDITDGLPMVPTWKDVKLVYLDPPYWKQAEGKYSDAPSDFGNMPIEQFTKTLASIIQGFGKKLTDAYIALIIQPTQWKSPDKKFTDHIGDMLRAVKLEVEMRYSCPYESQQCAPTMVEWAKANKKTLVLSREVVVWKV